MTGVALLIAYLATLAPGVTLWDAGEFASAARTLGVPHPPGTPLYVFVGRALDVVLPGLTAVQATNVLSALSTASACALLAALVARWLDSALAGIAAGVMAGLMTTVWLSANETEVYAVSLLLSSLMLWSGWRAGNSEDERFTYLTGYLFALSVPLHLSALVAAPAAVVLAAWHHTGVVRWARGLALAGAMIVVAGAGTVSWAVAVVGLIGLAASVVLAIRRGQRSAPPGLVLLTGLAVSVVVVMLVRARFDPGINQGNPATWSALLDVVARNQYDVPGLWPRRAPYWLQVANLAEYADWQVGLGVDRAIGAGMIRTPLTIAMIALGVVGARAHYERDRRTFWATLVLFGCATVGVVIYLNLLAGPSFGYGVLPDDAEREARERDYFFALGFATWGVWAGVGVADLARRFVPRRAPLTVAATLAAVAAVNWRSADRRHGPWAHLADRFGRIVLESSPRNAVLLVAGDNDTYPLWYLQRGEQLRPDVTTITLPLLAADWYRAELSRRFDLLPDSLTSRWRGDAATLRAIADAAARLGRPMAATVSVEARERAPMGGTWSLEGIVYVREAGSGKGETGGPEGAPLPASRFALPAIVATIARIDRLFPSTYQLADFPDPASRYIASLLDCPRLAREVAAGRDSTLTELLDSRCNFR